MASKIHQFIILDDELEVRAILEQANRVRPSPRDENLSAARRAAVETASGLEIRRPGAVNVRCNADVTIFS